MIEAEKEWFAHISDVQYERLAMTFAQTKSIWSMQYCLTAWKETLHASKVWRVQIVLHERAGRALAR